MKLNIKSSNNLYNILLILSEKNFELISISDLSDKFVSIKELHSLYSPEQYDFESLGVTVKIIDKLSKEVIGCVLLIHTTKIVLLPYNAIVVLLNRNEVRDMETSISSKFRPGLWGYFSGEVAQFGADKIVMSSTQIETYKEYSKSWNNNPDENHNVKIIEAIKDKVVFVNDWDYYQIYSYHLDTTTGQLQK